MDQQPPEFYANSVQATSGAYDVVMTFSVLTPVAGQQGPAATQKQDVCILRMSLHHAKSLAAILVNQMKMVESQLGALGMTPDMQALWDNNIKP